MRTREARKTKQRTARDVFFRGEPDSQEVGSGGNKCGNPNVELCDLCRLTRAARRTYEAVNAHARDEVAGRF